MHQNTYGKMMPYRWKEDSSIKVPEIIWREDMDTFVLEILRKSVAKKLSYLASRRAAYIAACKGRETISQQNQVGAVLWLGLDGEVSAQDAAPNSQVESSGPPPYAMHYYKSHYIPYYNLPTLLGPDHLRALREGKSSHFGGQYAVIKTKHNTKDVQMELWKLLGYSVNDKEEAGGADKVSENKGSEEGDLEDGEESDLTGESAEEVP